MDSLVADIGIMNKTTLKRLLVGEFSMKRVVSSAIFVYLAVMAYGFFFAERLIFQPQPRSYKDTRDILKLTTADGARISAVHLENPKARWTLLYSHGNAEDLGDILPVLEELRDLDFSVFAYDYHGYGTSEGNPTEDNAYRDIEAAYAYLTQPQRAPPERIIVFGRSVGSGPTVDLASRKPVAGMILESPFVTAFRVLTRIPLFPFDRFRNIEKIKKVQCPVLIIHGKMDRTIPCHHGEKLFARANEPKRCLWVEGANHDNVMWVGGRTYADQLRAFADLAGQTLDGKRPASHPP